MSDNLAVSTKLLSQYILWQGTPYRMGGLSKNGIDCSGFVHITFRSKFGYAIPRTTRTQVQLGSRVSKNALLPGDLVFFKTGLFSRHVGIYINDSKFIHASTSRGVMVSNLNERYWKNKYWTARRLDTL
ncbi:MAG: NlpC/P60 family protein [Thermodesulfobacteriota bacterium]